MTDWIDELSPDDDLQLDLLVDDELNETQRQRLLTHLEGDSGRWRLLALRYVESQMVAGTVLRSAAETPGNQNVAGKKHRKWSASARPRLGQLLMAVSVCTAFVIGLITHRFTGVTSNDGDHIVLSESDVSPPAGSKTPGALSPAEVGKPASPSSGFRQIRVPLRRVVDKTGQPGWSPRVRLSKAEEKSIRDQGLVVERRAGVVRVPFGDTRHVLMPAERVRVVPHARYRI